MEANNNNHKVDSLKRLMAEYGWWKDNEDLRKLGFKAKPALNKDGTKNYYEWKCKVPGPPNGYYTGGVYPVTLKFPADFPERAPEAYFPAGFIHCNIFSNGLVCIDLLRVPSKWQQRTRVGEILNSLSNMLNEPNWKSRACSAFPAETEEYKKVARQQAIQYAPKKT